MSQSLTPSWQGNPVGAEQINPLQPPAQDVPPQGVQYLTNQLQPSAYNYPMSAKDMVAKAGDPKVIDQILNTLGSMGGLGNTIVGPKAKGVDLDKLATAVHLDSMGLHSDKIENQTGWWKGADGQWKTWLDDTGASLNPRGVQTVDGSPDKVMFSPRAQFLPDVWNSPELYKAYPELQDLPVRNMPVNYLQSRLGYYQPQDLALALEQQGLGKFVDNSPYNPSHIAVTPQTPLEFGATMAHEVQHPVQHIENWTMGKGADYSKSSAEMEANAAMRMWEAAQNPTDQIALLAQGHVPMTARIESQYKMVPRDGVMVKQSLPFDQQSVGELSTAQNKWMKPNAP